MRSQTDQALPTPPRQPLDEELSLMLDLEQSLQGLGQAPEHVTKCCAPARVGEVTRHEDLVVSTLAGQNAMRTTITGPRKSCASSKAKSRPASATTRGVSLGSGTSQLST